MLTFAKGPEPCAHTAPTFGCDGCIMKDRTAALAKLYADTAARVCTTHGVAMEADADRVTMAITYYCPAEDCDEGDEVR